MTVSYNQETGVTEFQPPSMQDEEDEEEKPLLNESEQCDEASNKMAIISKVHMYVMNCRSVKQTAQHLLYAPLCSACYTIAEVLLHMCNYVLVKFDHEITRLYMYTCISVCVRFFEDIAQVR